MKITDFEDIKLYELLLKCDCGMPEYLEFAQWSEDMGFTVSMIDQPDTLWQRIQRALRYIFKGGNMYYKEVYLGYSELKELKEFINTIVP